MTELNQCERCGDVVKQSATLGDSCPRCMLELALGSGAEDLEDFDSESPSRYAAGGAELAGHPEAIARYRIIRLIGEGGMGAVYEAEQYQTRRIVALKIVKAGIATSELLRRFEFESQALGRLHHSGIAQIYEAGTADTGRGPQPYFAMEFIRGQKLTDYAKEHHLNTRQRMEMMARVAEAVHHAHQRGLIHRDLKPANILVDETGQPKLVDFGVARTTDSDMHATQTGTGQLVGTVAYMSPEQIMADPLELDTRSDVYALGVILYELLAGRLPYTISRNLPENIHAIRESDPIKLGVINRSYRGDIETIVGKALAKEKTMRYAAAAGMAADIHRYLNDEPIAASPPNASYHLRQFARKNKLLATYVAAVFMASVMGFYAWGANNERVRTRTDAKSSKDALNFINALEPYAKCGSGEYINLKSAIDQAVAESRERFAGQPLTQATVGEFNAGAYTRIGSCVEGIRELERAYTLRVHEQGVEHPDTVEDAIKLAYAHFNLKMYTHAEFWMKHVAETRRLTLGVGNPAALSADKQLIAFYLSRQPQPDYDGAEAYAKNLVGLLQAALTYDSPATQTSVNYLVSIYLNQPQPKYAEAVAFLQQVREQAKARWEELKEDRSHGLDGESRGAQNASIGLAKVYFIQDKIPEAKAQLVPYEAAIAKARNNSAAADKQPPFPQNIDRSRTTLESGNAEIEDCLARLTMVENPTILDAVDLLAQIEASQSR